MILDKLTKLDDFKRISAAVLIAMITAITCYFAIARSSVVKLQDTQASYAEMQAVCTEMENQQAEFPNLQKQFGDIKKQFQERQTQCFSRNEAIRFFENINALAMAHSLTPVSKTISEPKEIVSGKTDDPNVGPQQDFLKTQSANIAASGNYFDIVDFIKDITNCQQNVCLTNLYISLPAGEEYNPKASFEITLIIDLSKDTEK